jgi:hypothetical protein
VNSVVVSVFSEKKRVIEVLRHQTASNTTKHVQYSFEILVAIPPAFMQTIQHPQCRSQVRSIIEVIHEKSRHASDRM